MYKLSIIQKHTNLKISENILTCKKKLKAHYLKKIRKQTKCEWILHEKKTNLKVH